MAYLAFEDKNKKGDGGCCSKKINGMFNYALAYYMTDHYRQWSQTCLGPNPTLLHIWGICPWAIYLAL